MKEIVFENICKSYGKTHVVKNLNLTIKEGERLIILGPSGCGKSTTLRMIAGLEKPTSGNIYMDGKCVNEVKSGDRNIAMVFQNYALFPHMTVKENIIYGLKAHKIPKDDIDERLNAAVKMLRLEGLEDRKPKDLSGGQRQRVALARAVVKRGDFFLLDEPLSNLDAQLRGEGLEDRKPKDLSGGQRQRVALARAVVKRGDFFLLDEPLSNLDAQLRGHARKELVKIHETYKQTFIYVTHDQVEAMTIGDRIALMNKGDLQMLDTPQNVYNKPRNIFTAKFIGSPSMNIFDVDYKSGAININNQVIDLSNEWIKLIESNEASKLSFGVRPEHVELYSVKIANSFKGIVKYIEDYGNKIGVYFEIEGNEVIALVDEDTFKKGDYSVKIANSFKGIVKYIEDYGNKIGVYFEIEGNEVIALVDEDTFKKGDKIYFKPNFRKIHLFNRETTMSIGYPEEK